MNAYILSRHLNWDILIADKHLAAKKPSLLLSLDIKFFCQWARMFYKQEHLSFQDDSHSFEKISSTC